MEAALWIAEVDVPAARAEAAAAALERFTDTVSWFEAPAGRWSVAAYFVAPPDGSALEAALGAAGVMARPAIRYLTGRDWLAENRASFAPIRVGLHFIHASFYDGPVPAGARRIELDAGQAFGTGAHETTRGCLVALHRIARARRPRRALDLGTGSGILAIAMAQLWRNPVLAADIDPVAVGVAAGNVRRNGMGPWVRTLCAPGLRHRAIRAAAPFDLIAANILSRPLVRLAPQLARALAPGGLAVLSGLLRHQEAEVLAAYRGQNMALVRRVVLGDWPTLVLTRRGRPARAGLEARRRRHRK